MHQKGQTGFKTRMALVSSQLGSIKKYLLTHVDTMDVNNVTLDGLDYTGGDDCVAIKPRSFNVKINNVTCHGGNGIAIGSLGQYEEDSSVGDILFTNIGVRKSDSDDL